MSERGNFGTKLGVILATAGSAVGLGNIWRFPYMTGQDGGAAFIVVYLVCILLLGILAWWASSSWAVMVLPTQRDLTPCWVGADGPFWVMSVPSPRSSFSGSIQSSPAGACSISVPRCWDISMAMPLM
jgi:hypothetical protein